MIATNFKESNKALGPPKGMTEDEVRSLFVFQGLSTEDERVCISCWKMTAEELAEVNRTGRVWLVVSGLTMFPVRLQVASPFDG